MTQMDPQENYINPPSFFILLMDQTPSQSIQFPESHRYNNRLSNRPRSPYPTTSILQNPLTNEPQMSEQSTSNPQRPILQPSEGSSPGEQGHPSSSRERMEGLLRATGVPSAFGGSHRRPRSAPTSSSPIHVLPESPVSSSRAPPSYETRRGRQSHTPRPSGSGVPNPQASNFGGLPSLQREREHPRMAAIHPPIFHNNVQNRVLGVHANNMDAQFEDAPFTCRMEIGSELIRFDIVRDEGQYSSIRFWFGEPDDDGNAGIHRE